MIQKKLAMYELVVECEDVIYTRTESLARNSKTINFYSFLSQFKFHNILKYYYQLDTYIYIYIYI